MNRLDRLSAQLAHRGLDCLAVVPGANLFYLTGLRFMLSERPVVAFFPDGDTPAIVLPELEAGKLEADDVPEMDPFTYSDEEGYASAFQQACATLELADALIGVEALHMRVLELRLLERYAPGLQVQAADDVLGALRLQKEVQELDSMRKAVAITEQALRETLPHVHPGMTERQIANELTAALQRLGAEGNAFETTVLSGPNSANPHAAPSTRRIAIGDILLFDFGITINGYVSDITRTFFVGQADPELAHIYDVVRAANAAGRAAAGPGVPCEEVDRAARRVVTEAGFGPQFMHRTGHGIGLEVHEPPYMVAGNTQTLAPGMTFTVEPGIYLPGRGGVRIEDDLVITEHGAESLTTFSRDLTIL